MSRKKSPITGKTKRRMAWFFVFIISIYIGLTLRLAYIQLVKADEYKNKARLQSEVRVDLSSGRGIIYDRNNKPLTDSKKEQIIIIDKSRFDVSMENMNLLTKVTNMSYGDLCKAFEKDPYSPVVELTISYMDDNLKGKLLSNNVLIEEKTLRYSQDNLLSHTIGYIKKSTKEGQQGIEKAQEDLLKDKNEDYIEVFKAGDGAKQNGYDIGILQGTIKTNKENKDDSHLKLTIDSDIQKIVEKSADKVSNPSAVVISSVGTGEILAISSRPNFNPNSIADYLNDDGLGELINRPITAKYSPGSVFKIVVLFAALETGVIDTDYTYECTGTIRLGDVEKKCLKIEGHGLQTLNQAFANSCNTAFIDIAIKVGKTDILKASNTLHLAQKVDIGLDEEKYGELPQANEIDVMNLGIGQSKLEFTPLQVNQMTQLIANNGMYKQLHIYDSVIDNKGSIIKNFETKNSEEIVSPYTINKVKEMMKSVANEGTAKDLSELNGGAGVKTGTAQAKDKNKNLINHGWVTGFYPASNPKYAITILVENTDEGSKAAVSIFKDICQKIK